MNRMKKILLPFLVSFYGMYCVGQKTTPQVKGNELTVTKKAIQIDI